MSNLHHSKLSPLKSLWKPGFNALVEARLPQSRKKRRILGLLAVVIFAVGVYVIFFRPQSTEAAWYDDSWAYRQAIPITSTNGSAQSNVFISFTLDTATLITAGKLQSSCQDIRITDVGGKILNYHVGRTNACNNAATTIDFLTSSFPDGTSTYYVYYGNPSASSQDVGAFSQSQASNYSVGALATAEASPGPVAYWKFDEGTGTNAQDSTANNNDGTISGAAWQTEDQCITGKCLQFDGTDDYVDMGSSSILDNIPVKTVTFWTKLDAQTGITAASHFINKGDSSWFIATDPSNSRNIFGQNFSTTSGRWSYPQFSLHTWHHVAVIYDRTSTSNDPIIYVDGISQPITEYLTPSGTVADDSANSLLISKSSGFGHWVDGRIDDVKIYPYARTAAQVLTDYNSRGSVKGSSASLGGNTETMKQLSNGLVGYWKMDEASGNTADSSGNGTTLTNNNTTTYAAGKFGNSGSFAKASTQYFSAVDSSTLRVGTGNFAISSWVYLNSATIEMAIASKYDTASKKEWVLEYNFTDQRFEFIMSPNGTSTTVVKADNLGAPTTGQWYFVVGWYDGVNMNISVNGGTPNTGAYTSGTTSNTAPFEIGGLLVNGVTTLTWDGKIDEVRLYKRALSTADISALYNFAPGPVGYWDFDENQGTSANDKSSNGNTGTWNGTGTSRWKPGKYGASGNFNGTDDYVDAGDPANGILDFGTNQNFTASAWVKMTSTGSSSQRRIVSKYSSGGWSFHWNNTPNALRMTLSGDGTNFCTVDGTTNIEDGKWHYVTTVVNRNASCTTSDILIYVDGVKETTSVFASAANANANVSTAGTLRIGTLTQFFQGNIDDVKIYNYARTAKQIVEDMNAGHPAVGSPVGSAIGHWKFDEGADNMCSGGTNDTCNSGSGGSTLDGAKTGATWTNSGKFGKALNFNGSTNYVSITDNPALDIASSYTLTMWVNLDQLASTKGSAHSLTNKVENSGGNSRTFYTFVNTNDKLDWIQGTGSGITSANSDTALAASTWYHVTFVLDDTLDQMRIYLNGRLDMTPVSFTATPSTNNSALRLGGLTGVTGFADIWTDGTLDEVKVYSYALTADEVKIDMNRSSSQVLGALSDKSTYQPQAANQEYCVPGDTTTSCAPPVGEWKFDEKQGTTAKDTSGNGFTGTLTNSPKWKSGKIGSGVIVNSTDQSYITMGNINKTIYTLSVWFKPNSTVDSSSNGGLNNFITFIDGSGHFLDVWLQGANATGACTNEVLTLVDTRGVNPRTCSTSITSISPVWNHFVMVWNASTSNYNFYLNGQLQTVTKGTATAHVGLITATAFQIGQRGSSPDSADSYGDFTIDQLRIYDYARSAAQIQWDYNRGAPVGHWKFDECQGTTAYDDSRNANGTTNGNNGTITVGALGTQTAVGTCTGSSGTMWKDGAMGKYNSSLDFDGTDDYVSVTDSVSLDITSAGTLSVWTKVNSNSNQVVLGKGANSFDCAQWEYGIWFYSDGRVGACAGRNSSFLATNGDIGSTAWHHIVYTWTSSSDTLYVDGSVVKTGSGGASSGSSETLTIGALGNASSPFNGQIDDIKLYNYALTATQIRNLYNGDAAFRIGPVTGSP